MRIPDIGLRRHYAASKEGVVCRGNANIVIGKQPVLEHFGAGVPEDRNLYVQASVAKGLDTLKMRAEAQ